MNGAEPGRLGDAQGRVAAVLFSPADVALVSEGPGVRRRFLDIVLSLNVPGYLEALQRFRQALSQRNAALKEGRGPGSVHVWEPGLVENGSRVLEERLRWSERWAPAFSGYYRRISGARDGTLTYRPGVRLEGAEGLEGIREAFLE